MKVLMLVAGQSKRFWPLSEKPLFPICGMTLLGHQLKRLHAAGLTDVVLVGSANNLTLIQTLYPDIPAVEQEDLSLGMRGALLSALPQCGNSPVMIVSGNDVIDPTGYTALLRAASERGVDGALLARKVDSYFPGGYLTLAGNRVTGIVEKPGEGNEPSDLVNIVAHVHNEPQTLLDALRIVDLSNENDDGHELALADLIRRYDFRAVPFTETWQAVKYPWHMLDLLPALLREVTESSFHPSTSVHRTAVVSGPVVLGEGARVMPHATIVGPCSIGKNSIIGTSTLVRGSSIGEHCVVGFGTEIKDSVLSDHVWAHMCYIGDSVIGRNVAFGGGGMLGNFRLDEQEIHSAIGEEEVRTGRQKFGAVIGDDCRLGIHLTVNPGIKIGKGSFVSSGVLLEKDVPDCSFVRMRNGCTLRTDNRVHPLRPEARSQYYGQLGHA